MKNLRIKIIKAIGVALAGIGFAGMIVGFFISTWHLQNAPLEANPGTGEVHPFFIRGVTIYLTKLHWFIEEYLFSVMAVIVGVSLVFFGWADRSSPKFEKFGLRAPDDE